jgi:hypothetical protein
MPAPLAPWTQVMLDRLADGRWHSADELLALALPTIPQQRCLRETERERARKRVGDASPAHQSDPVLRGARDIVRKTLHGFVRYGRVEHEGDRYRKATAA